MIYSGEYVEGLVRTTNVQFPVMAGYVTARLRVDGDPEVSVSGFVNNTTMVSLRETSGSACTMILMESDDYTSGPKEYVGAAQSLVPYGRTTYSVTPRLAYLEVQGFSGTAAVYMQLSSRLRWTQMGFAKTDMYYNPVLYTAKDPLTQAV